MRFYSGSMQPGLHPLSSNFNPKLKVPLIQASKPSIQAIQLDYGSNSLSWTFGSKHLLHFSRDIPFLNNPSSDTPHLRNFLSKIYK